MTVFSNATTNSLCAWVIKQTKNRPKHYLLYLPRYLNGRNNMHSFSADYRCSPLSAPVNEATAASSKLFLKASAVSCCLNRAANVWMLAKSRALHVHAFSDAFIGSSFMFGAIQWFAHNFRTCSLLITSLARLLSSFWSILSSPMPLSFHCCDSRSVTEYYLLILLSSRDQVTVRPAHSPLKVKVNMKTFLKKR